MSSAAFSIPNGSQPKISLNRRGQRPSTATSAAADEAIRQILNARRRRHQYGQEPEIRQSALGVVVDQLNAAVGESVGRLGFGRWVTRALVLGVFGVVLAGAAAIAVPGSDDSRYPIGGVVLYEGKPLANGVIEFHRAGKAGSQPLSITTDAKGRFHRDAADGLSCGAFAVVVRSGQAVTGRATGRIAPAAIPSKYQDPTSTPLRVSVSEPNVGMQFAIHR